jgi:hypothetical protein
MAALHARHQATVDAFTVYAFFAYALGPLPILKTKKANPHVIGLFLSCGYQRKTLQRVV